MLNNRIAAASPYLHSVGTIAEQILPARNAPPSVVIIRVAAVRPTGLPGAVPGLERDGDDEDDDAGTANTYELLFLTAVTVEVGWILTFFQNYFDYTGIKLSLK